MSTSPSFLASITFVGALMGGFPKVMAVGSDYFDRNSVYEVPLSLRNIFPAENFNRDVTTAWWETEVLDGLPSEEASEASKALKDASFLVLDQAMYEVGTALRLPWPRRWFLSSIANCFITSKTKQLLTAFCFYTAPCCRGPRQTRPSGAGFPVPPRTLFRQATRP